MSGEPDDNRAELELKHHLADELTRPVQLSNPVATGEKLSAFIRRAIASNPDVADPARTCRSFGIDINLPGVFCPASGTEAVLKNVHDGLAALQVDPADSENARLFDAMWTTPPGGVLPLDIRMALLPPIVLVMVRQHELRRSYTPIRHRLDLARLASKRRDSLLTQLCERLRDGWLVATAFAANDPQRTSTDVPAGWWADPAVACAWGADELRPVEGAPIGTPYYRGIVLVPKDADPPVSTLGPGPKTSLIMIDTLRRLEINEGRSFPNDVARHQAVLKELGLKDEPRGYSYKTFQRQLSQARRQPD